MTPPPKISIVTPSFNQGAFLEKTIDSVLSQGYPNLEYILIDGGSTDDSLDIIRKYAPHLDYWVSEKDRGQSHAINKGFARATGEIMSWLNSDDYLEPDALNTVASYAAAHPDAGAFVGTGRKITVGGEITYLKKPGELTFERFCQWLEGGNFMQPSCFFRRSAWEAAGPLDENIHIALDVDLWLRMVKHVRFQAIDALLSTALAHEGAKTTAFRNRMIVDCSLTVIRAGGEPYVRKHLDKLADQLTEYQGFYSRLAANPVVRLVKPLLRPFVKKPQ